MIALFLIPGSYLVVNYGIDFANSVQYTVSSEYQRLFAKVDFLVLLAAPSFDVVLK